MGRMKRAAVCAWISALALTAQAPPAGRAARGTTAVSAGLPPGQSKLYPGNRAPLRELPLVKLPAGAVEPDGWLGEQLRRMARGFSGRLPELSQYCRREGNAWLDPR